MSQPAQRAPETLDDGYIPVIDISPFFTGRPEAKQEVADKIGEACREIGFYIIVGHGVSTTLTDQVERVSRTFFGLPADEKMKVHVGKDATSVGYSAVGEKVLAHTRGLQSPPDLMESFQIVKVDVDPSDSYYHTPEAKKLIPPNQWPDNPSEFKDVLSRYYLQMGDLARNLLRLSALALKLPEDYFDSKIDRHMGRLTLRHYPEQKENPLPDQLRAGAHSDFGTITILRPDASVGGLQVADQAGNWHDVPIVPNSFVINQGDLMARWTNDHWIATLHRVVNPPENARRGNRRMSIVFFHHPNYNTVIECLPTCSGPGDSAKYEPVTVAEYYRLKKEQQRAKS